MIFLGFGEIFGSVLNGYLNDKLGIKKFTIVFIFQFLLAFALLISFNQYDTWNYGFACVTCFFWGSIDAGIEVFKRCILGY